MLHLIQPTVQKSQIIQFIITYDKEWHQILMLKRHKTSLKITEMKIQLSQYWPINFPSIY